MLQQINVIGQSRSIIDKFYGLNNTESIQEGQFEDMLNISSDSFPAMSLRKRREFLKTIKKPNGLIHTDKLVYVDGKDLYYDGIKVLELTDTQKTMVVMGAYLCIFPDKVVFNTESGDCFDMEAHYTSKAYINVEPSTYNGEKLEYTTEKPEKASDGAYWLDDGVLKQYSSTYSTWMSVPTSYLRISESYASSRNENFGKEFEEGDTISISGFTDDGLNGDFIIYKCSNGYMVIGGSPRIISQQTPDIHFDRNVPDMEYVIAANNRLWGCSSANHEIYASKLGDPTNWNAYAGLSNDSYAVTVGSYGEFTGAAYHLGYVLFFKEDSMIKIYGTEPANFSLKETRCRGVEKGSDRSLAIVNEILYYKSKDGICQYDGTLPTTVSTQLGHKKYANAVAGSNLSKLYISMQDERANYSVLVYDQQKGIWTKEDSRKIVYMTSNAETLYMMYEDSLNALRIKGNYKGIYPGVEVVKDGRKVVITPGLFYPGQVFEDDFEDTLAWYAETGDIATEYPDRKYITKIIVRISAEELFEMSIQYDSDGVWEKILSISGTAKKRAVSIPVRIRRCDHVRFRFNGKGEFKLFAITKSLEQGSDV